MKKLTVSALFLLAITALPTYGQSIATITQIEVEDGVKATKSVAVTRAGKSSTLAVNAEVKLNDVIKTDSKPVTIKIQNGATWKLDVNTQFSITDYQGGKAVYTLIGGDANYQAKKATADATLKVNNKDYVINAEAEAVDVSVSYDGKETLLIIRDGSVKVGNDLVPHGHRIKINADGEVSIAKDRGVRGHHDADAEATDKKGQYDGVQGLTEEKKE